MGVQHILKRPQRLQNETSVFADSRYTTAATADTSSSRRREHTRNWEHSCPFSPTPLTDGILLQGQSPSLVSCSTAQYSRPVWQATEMKIVSAIHHFPRCLWLMTMLLYMLLEFIGLYKGSSPATCGRPPVSASRDAQNI